MSVNSIRTGLRARRLSSVPDESLVELIRDGDERALLALYDRHSALAYGLAFRIVQLGALAEDAVARAFATLWASREELSPGRLTPRTLIISLVHRHAVELLRGEPAKRAAPDAPDDPDLALHACNPCAALLDLTGEERRALLLAYYGGRSPAELATVDRVSGASMAATAGAALRRLAGLIIEPGIAPASAEAQAPTRFTPASLGEKEDAGIAWLEWEPDSGVTSPAQKGQSHGK